MIKNIVAFSLVVLSFITLCSLGVWQLQRAQWKGDIITQLEKEYAKNPMAHRLLFDDLKKEKIQQGHIRGRFDYSNKMLFGPKTKNDAIGYDVLIPMNLERGGVILVNLGWAEGDKKQDIRIETPPRTIVVTGIARKPDWNRFTPNNSPKNNIWTKLDISQIADAKNIDNIAPSIFYAKSSLPKFNSLKTLEDQWFPRDKHIQYATFWFAMAIMLLSLVGIFFVKQRKRN
jgi:surfeit locus 1 family protein